MRDTEVSGRGILGLLVVAVIVAFAVQLGLHAHSRHAEAPSVASMFNRDGSCKKGPSMEMYNPETGYWAYICFHDGDKVSMWFLTNKIDELGREITRIPARDISRPMKYLRNVIRRGYMLGRTYGRVPDWAIRLFDLVVQP
jgi:hypothetical protein